MIGRIDAFAVVPAPSATGSFGAVQLVAASLVGLTISGWFNGGPKCVCVHLLVVCCLWFLPATYGRRHFGQAEHPLATSWSSGI